MDLTEGCHLITNGREYIDDDDNDDDDNNNINDNYFCILNTENAFAISVRH